jgi:hypothetical protein
LRLWEEGNSNVFLAEHPCNFDYCCTKYAAFSFNFFHCFHFLKAFLCLVTSYIRISAKRVEHANKARSNSAMSNIKPIGLPVTFMVNRTCWLAESLHTKTPAFWCVMLLNFKVLTFSSASTEAEMSPNVWPLSAIHVIDAGLMQLIWKLVPNALDTSLTAGSKRGVPSEEKQGEPKSSVVPKI